MYKITGVSYEEAQRVNTEVGQQMIYERNEYGMSAISMLRLIKADVNGTVEYCFLDAYCKQISSSSKMHIHKLMELLNKREITIINISSIRRYFESSSSEESAFYRNYIHRLIADFDY